jgi:hypothetical protein
MPATTWRAGPEALSQMASAFSGLRDICELSWHTATALQILHDHRPRMLDSTLVTSLRDRLHHLQSLAEVPLGELMGVDMSLEWSHTTALLNRTSKAIRGRGAKLHRADLAGRDLRGMKLTDAYLRGATLIATDLRAVDLTRADLLGVDMRDADLRGTRLHSSLFLTNAVVASAHGDATTTLPKHLVRPTHWG